jgi:hypothetical protein
VSFCTAGVGDTGYEAAIECSSVQVDRPRTSTSGGQSRLLLLLEEEAEEWWEEKDEDEDRDGADGAGVESVAAVMDDQAAKEVQARHLRASRLAIVVKLPLLVHLPRWGVEKLVHTVSHLFPKRRL